MIELSTYSLRWDPSDICTKMWTNCLTKRVKANVHSLHLSDWRQTRARRLCQKSASVYRIQCRQDTVIVISICFWRDATLTFSLIKCQPLRDWMPVGGACVNVFLWRQCLCKRLCPGDITWHLGSKRVVFWGLLHKYFFFIDDEDILSYETCRMY